MAKYVRDTSSKKDFVKKWKARPTLWKFNEQIYMMECSGGKHFNVVRKSDGQVLARQAISFGWQMSLGFYYANRCMHYTNKTSGLVKMMGMK